VIGWDEPGAKDTLVSALVNDANALLAAFAEVGPGEWGEQAHGALALPALVAGQDVEPAEGSDGTDGRWRIARRVAPDRVVSTLDPDARHTRTSPEARRDGYRAQVAAEPETGIITDEALTKAAGTENSDPGVAEKFLAADDGGEVGAREWYGDSAYGTGAGGGWVHRRRRHRRRGIGHGGLPGGSHSPDQPDPVAGFGASCRECPPAGAVHHIQDRP
jgi:hypothetical protein